jgi:hypothetical protein
MSTATQYTDIEQEIGEAYVRLRRLNAGHEEALERLLSIHNIVTGAEWFNGVECGLEMWGNQ